MDYNEFSEKIKAKYPQYKDIDNKELAQKMVEKYPQYKGQIVFDVPKNVEQKGVDLTPSGLIDTTANAIVSAIETPYRMVKDKQNPVKAFKSAYNVGRKARKSFEKEHPVLSGARDLGVDLLGYGLLPNKGGFVGQAAIQGGIPFALESLKEGENPLTGFGIGTGLGMGIQALPYVGKVAGIVPSVSKYVARTVGRLEPETLLQAVKPNSKALDLNSKAKLTDFANNITKRVRNTYEDLLTKRGEDVKNAINNLGLENERINAEDIRNEIKQLFDSYNRDMINPARNMAGGLETELNELVNQAERGTTDLLNNELVTLRNDLRLDDDILSNNYLWSNEKADEAYKILSEATGKPINWLKSQLNASQDGANWFGRQVGREDNYLRGMTKRQEGIEDFLKKYAENPENQFMSGERFNFYNNQGQGLDIVEQAYNDIINRNFYKTVSDPMELGLARADNTYRKLLNNLLEKDSITVNDLNKFFDEDINSVLKYVPDEMAEDYIARAVNDWEKIENYINKRNTLQGTISPMSLQGIKEQVGKMTKWSDEVARNYHNPILERLYGRLQNRLSSLSPELAEANRGYAELSGLKKKEGINRILKSGDNIDSATRALDNFDSSYLKGNTSQNVRDLENIFTQEGYAPFVNDVEDVIAAKNLNKIATTGDSWLANVTTALTKPALMGARAFNRTNIPQFYQNTVERLSPLAEKLLTPIAVRGIAPMMLQGGVSNLTDEYGYGY